jgi:hypothetical protein
MKYRSKPNRFLALTLGILATSPGAMAGDTPLLEPDAGTFDSFRVNEAPPEPWSTFFVTEPSRIIVSKESQSPFQDEKSHSASSKSGLGILWEDADVDNPGPMMAITLEDIGESDELISWKFDFMVPDPSTSIHTMINLAETKGSASAAGPSIIICRTEGELQAHSGSTLKRLTGLDSNRWYRVSVMVDQSARTYDVDIQPFGVQPESLASGLVYRNNHISRLKFMNISEGSPGKEGGVLHLDNVSVTVPQSTR